MDSDVFIFLSPLWLWKGLFCFVISHVGLYTHLPFTWFCLTTFFVACQCNCFASYT